MGMGIVLLLWWLTHARLLLHSAQRAANRVLIVPCRHLEHPSRAPPSHAKRRLHKPKVYLGQLQAVIDKQRPEDAPTADLVSRAAKMP